MSGTRPERGARDRSKRRGGAARARGAGQASGRTSDRRERGSSPGTDRASATRSAEKPSFRIFLAVFPPPEVQQAAYALAESLRATSHGVSWVKAENLHYTLRFMGEVGADGVRRIAEAVAEASAVH